jgi:hypothetical protein
MPITRPRAWIALAGVAVLLMAVALWALFASIETTITAYGTLVRHDGIVQVRAPSVGVLANVSVKVGDAVTSGQTLAFVAPTTPSQKPIAVVSPNDGRVVDMQARAEQKLEEAQAVLTIESPQQPLSAVLYVATPDGYRVQAGMKARVLPATAGGRENAFLLGEVTEAGRTPVQATSDGYAPASAGVYVLKVIVAFDAAAANPEIFTGTPCTGQIIIGKRRPVDFIFAVLGRR